TVPTAWFSADASSRVSPTFLAQKPPVDMSDVDVTRVEATSKDGTKVPMSVLRIKGSKSGDAPTLLTGYGGFGISTSPTFSKGSRAWLEQGGVVALCNMRGGGENGDAWHRAGMKTHKQNVFDDFIACAELLTSGPDRVTSSAHLAIQGGSNGGLLMGAALTQRPDLFKCVVAQVGYFDMLRYETKPNGAFNNAEYGSVANEDEYRALKAYSPYHAVKDGTKYPPTLFMTGANDPRVDPLHSRKMVARLQAAGAQAILRTSGGTGHGGATPLSARIAETVDVDAFLFDALGVAYHAP
ncbi:MAG TPA: prolyl oligopeptidase family serine peptidase, partial [Myxococcota bacterium]